MSTLSTQNDELLLILYRIENENQFTNPLVLKRITLDNENRKKTFNTYSPHKLSYTSYRFVLIEMDSGVAVTEIDRIVQKNYDGITQSFQTKDYAVLKNILGDDDVLGVLNIDKLPFLFNCSGSHRLDRYEFYIEIE